MKIKTKKLLNLPQLIEWAWDNDIKNKEYPCDGFEDKTVIFNTVCWAEFSDEYSYNKTDTFTVEVEEEVKEQRDQYKAENGILIDELTWYKAKVNRLEREKAIKEGE